MAFGTSRRQFLASVVGGGAALPFVRFQSNPALVVDVKQFGAVGDGITNDTTAIQMTLDSLKGTGGTVLLPASTYMITDSLIIPDNVAFVGEGIGVSVLILGDETNKRLVGIVRTIQGAITKNVTVRDLTIDGNRENQSEEEQFGFYTGVTPGEPEADEDITVVRVEARNCSGYGFDPHEITTRLYLIDCLSHHNGKDGFALDGVRATVVRGCIAWQNDRHGFNIITGSEDSSFSGNMAYENKATGITVQNEAHRNLISDNIIYRNAEDGVYMIDVEDNVIQGNYIYENGTYGIRVRGCLRATVHSNRLRDNCDSADDQYAELQVSHTEQGSTQCSVSGNHITSSRARFGIFEQAGEGTATQADNMFASNKVFGAIRDNYRIEGTSSVQLANG